jgi:predicted NAD/FAD-dependent oxidoreductase
MRPGQTASEGGTLTGPHDALVIAAPAPQAAALLATAGHAFAAPAAAAVIAPCWAVMARFPDTVPGTSVLDGAGPVIAWAARERSRPGRAAEPEEAWTLHASPAWSRAHLEESPDAVCRALLDAFRAATGAPAADWARAHRWRHAQVETPVGQACLWDPSARIGACGDWCLGPRIEAAYDSGTALAASILAS